MSICKEYGCNRLAIINNLCNICYNNLLECENSSCNNKIYDAKIMCNICYKNWINETKEEYIRRLTIMIDKPRYNKKSTNLKKCKFCNLYADKFSLYCIYCNYSYLKCKIDYCKNKILFKHPLHKLTTCLKHNKNKCIYCHKNTNNGLYYCRKCALKLSYCRNCEIIRIPNSEIFCYFCYFKVISIFNWRYVCECYKNKKINPAIITINKDNYKFSFTKLFDQHKIFNTGGRCESWNNKTIITHWNPNTKYIVEYDDTYNNEYENKNNDHKHECTCYEYINYGECDCEYYCQYCYNSYICNGKIISCLNHICKREIEYAGRGYIIRCSAKPILGSDYCKYHGPYYFSNKYNIDLYFKKILKQNYILPELLKIIFSYIDYEDFKMGMWCPQLNNEYIQKMSKIYSEI